MKLLGAVLSVWTLAIWTPRVPEPTVHAVARVIHPVREVELGQAAREVARVTGTNLLVNQALERVKVPEGLGTPADLATAAKAQAVRLGHVSGRPTWALVPVGHPAFTAPAGEGGQASTRTCTSTPRRRTRCSGCWR